MIDFTKNNFRSAVANSSVVVVDFWASWCSPCKSVMPLLEQIASEYKNEAIFGKINIDNEHDLATEYSVRSIPTVLIIKNGTVVDRLIGQNITPSALTESINLYTE